MSGRLLRQYERSAREVAQWPMWMRAMLAEARARERMTMPRGDEIDRLRAEVARLEATVLELSEQKEALASEEIARLRKALEFYADLKSWKTGYEDMENGGGRYVTSPILRDEGQRAYEALEEK